MNLGDIKVSMMFAKRVRDDWGHGSNYVTENSYTNTRPEDYDSSMVSKLININPIYNLHLVLDYHLEYYLDIKKGEIEAFVRHIKYVIIPLVKKRNSNNKEECIELINEWIDSLVENKSNIWIYAGILVAGTIVYNQYHANQKLEREINIINNKYLESLKNRLEKENKLPNSVSLQIDYIINRYQGIDIKVTDELKCILELIGQDKKAESIFKLTKIIENLLKNKFVSQGIYTNVKNCPSLYKMINEAVSLNWISDREGKFIDILREPRNLEAHELAVQLNENEFYIYLFAGFEILYSLIGISYHKIP